MSSPDLYLAEQFSELSAFYEETDPEKRREMLSALSQEKASDRQDAAQIPGTGLQDCEAAQQIFRFRFSEDLSEDRFLQAILNLMFLTRSSRTLKVLERRNARTALMGLGLYGPEAGSASGLNTESESGLNSGVASDAAERREKLLLLEIRNAVLRYLMTCESDLYGRKFLGMIRSSEVQKTELIRRDLEDLSVRLPARLKAAGLSEFEEAVARLGEAVRSAAEQVQH